VALFIVLGILFLSVKMAGGVGKLLLSIVVFLVVIVIWPTAIVVYVFIIIPLAIVFMIFE
jgi:hypothetical protein